MQLNDAIKQVEMALTLRKGEQRLRFEGISMSVYVHLAPLFLYTYMAPQMATIPLRTAMIAAPIAETTEERQLATAPMMCIILFLCGDERFCKRYGWKDLVIVVLVVVERRQVYEHLSHIEAHPCQFWM